MAEQPAPRKRPSSVLRRTEELFRAVFDNIKDAFIIHDLVGRILEVNREACERLGYSHAELVGMRSQDIDVPEYAARANERIEMVRRQGHCLFESVHRRRDGSVVPVEVNRRLFEHQGRSLILDAARDLTARNQATEALLQARKMEAIGRLAGGVAHDFNNLLMIIVGRGELLLSRIAQNNPLRRDIERIHKTGLRAADLTQQLLAFSCRQMLEPKLLDLNGLIRGLEGMLRRLLGEQVKLATVLEPSLRSIQADPSQLAQAIINLAVNARDAMPDGGEFTLRTSNASLDEHQARLRPGIAPGPCILLEASDTGCGMSAETQAKIFEPFFTTKDVGKGTGLGLATVHGIIQQSGGYTAVQSQEGKGTTFKIYLPQADTANVAQAVSLPLSSQARQPAPQGKETVLLVEDEEAVGDLIREVLETNGYTVLMARQGAEALRLAGAHPGPIDLLLTDIVMPGMSGLELARQLSRSRPGIKLLFSSGYTDYAAFRREVSGTGAAFIQKPISPGLLARKVREVLDS